MRLEQMTALTPDPPQDDAPLHEGKCNEYLPRQREEQQREENLPQEREKLLPRQRKEQQREENIPREREEFLPQLREEQLFREREEHLPQESEGQDRERERVEHGLPKCEDEGDIFDAEILLDFLRQLGSLIYQLQTQRHLKPPLQWMYPNHPLRLVLLHIFAETRELMPFL